MDPGVPDLPREPDPVALIAFLERHGYRAVLALDDAWECLLRRGGERWAGSGASERAALEDALRRALPSRLGRDLLATAFERQVREARDVLGGSAVAAPASGVDGAPATAPGPTPDASPDATPAATADTAPQHSREGDDSDALEAGAATAGGETSALTLSEALDQVAEIAGAVSALSDEVAAWSPDRQRLQVLAWIAAARSIQDDLFDDRVEYDVARLASELARLLAIWWPGSVPALQLDAEPWRCRALLETDDPPDTWGQVAEGALQQLEVVQREGDAAGLDERGWADANALQPGPDDGAAELDDLARTLVAWTWSLDKRPRDDEKERPLPPLGGVLDLARRARWVRSAVDDSARWGAVIGRLRFLAERHARVDARASDALREALEPGTNPRQGWARLLGRDPEARQRQKIRKRLVKQRPLPDDARPTDQLEAWIREALLCEDLPVDRLARLVDPVRDLVRGLEPASLSDRRARRRLVRVVELVEGQPTDVPAPAGDEAVDVDAALDVAPPVPDAAEVMLAALLPRTRGRSALLVSNRADPDQDRVLEETFGLRIDHEVASPRVLSALADRIRAGRYDLVLSVTGFQAHKTDAKLAGAARDSGVPYVRVNRGRRVACIRALHRDLVRGS